MRGPPPEAFGIYAPPEVLDALGFTWFREHDFIGKIWTPGPDLESTTAGSQLINTGSSNSSGLQLELVQKLSEMVNSRPGDLGSNPMATAVYDAKMHHGNDHSDDVIVKIYMRLPSLPRDGQYLNFTEKRLTAYLNTIHDESNEKAEISCTFAESDWDAGQHLTEKSCSSTSRYLFYFDARDYNPWIRGHYMYFIVQERLPGIPLSTIWHWNQRVPEDAELRRRIITAFKAAYVDTLQCDVWHEDETSRNVMWDELSGRCFLFDFEFSSIFCWPASEGTLTWENVNKGHPHPDWVLRKWAIVTDEMENEMTQARKRQQRQIREEEDRRFKEYLATRGKDWYKPLDN